MALQFERVWTFLRSYWWVPTLTLMLGVGGAAAYLLSQAPSFVSDARMWETLKVRLPDGPLFAENDQNYVGTQTELLQSDALRDQVLARLQSSSNNVAIPIGKDGKPVPVKVRASQVAKSSVYLLEATGPEPIYTRAYLNELMQVYLEYKRNVRKVVSGDTLASISEQVQKAERDLRNEQDVLNSFERTNALDTAAATPSCSRRWTYISRGSMERFVSEKRSE